MDQLIEETINEALSECMESTKTKENGIVNLAYDRSEVDSAITQRINSNKPNGKPCEIPQTSSPPNLKKCVHNRKKPLIMLIHGLGSTADIWNILINNLLYKGFEVVAPDLLGHGYSSAPNKASFYHFKNLLSQTLAVFDYFMKKEDKRKCILIGHSYG